MSTLIQDGSRAAARLISIFSPLLHRNVRGDALLSRKGLYSLLAKMSFPKTYLPHRVRAGRR